jgi:hypothetical protein
MFYLQIVTFDPIVLDPIGKVFLLSFPVEDGYADHVRTRGHHRVWPMDTPKSGIFFYTAECQGCHVITGFSAGHSSAVLRVLDRRHSEANLSVK